MVKIVVFYENDNKLLICVVFYENDYKLLIREKCLL
jgi:hypothetical protein